MRGFSPRDYVSRTFRTALLAWLPAAAMLFLPAADLSADSVKSAVGENRRNLLLITVDTLRADRLGCYGCRSAATPVIDGLAAGGAVFERAFAHVPLTLPSHACILLGRTPPAHGVHDNSGFVVPPGEATLAEWLKERGYATAAFIGAFPLDSRFGLAQGFDVYDDNYGVREPGLLEFAERRADAVVDLARAWLGARTGLEPWFLWIHVFDPHQPWRPPEPFRTRFPASPYDGEIAYTDRALGSLLADVRERDSSGRTFVVLTADHGEALGDHGELTHGYFAYNATLRVPLIISGPGIGPVRVRGNAAHVDLLPTVCDLLGIAAPAGLQGISLRPFLAGKAVPARPIFFESLNSYYGRGWAPLRGFLEGDEKFIDLPLPELYDLRADPGETRNLAAGRDPAPYRASSSRLLAALSTNAGARPPAAPDKRSRETLRSLGYVVSTPRSPGRAFTAADDLKTLLPLHQGLMEALALRDGGRIGEGIARLRKLIAERGGFDEAATTLAALLKEQGRIDEAVELLRTQAASSPASFPVLTALGIGLVETGRTEEAIPVLRRALDIIDFDPEAWNYLGVASYSRGDLAEARRAYERALALDAGDAIVICNLGTLDLTAFRETQDGNFLKAAVSGFRRAAALDPAYAPAYNGLGAALRMSGDVEGAVGAWTRAVELKPDFGFPLFNLGLTLLDQGKKAQALDYLNRYKKLAWEKLSDAERRALEEARDRARAPGRP